MRVRPTCDAGGMDAKLEAPRFEHGKPLMIVGLRAHYTSATADSMPAQWQKFVPHLGKIPGQAGSTTYGVLYNGDQSGNVDYLCGVEVANFDQVPAGLDRLRIPEQRYAVFTHRANVSKVKETWAAILEDWVPRSGAKLAGAPEFERYDERFDPRSGEGGLEIWVPVKL